jgi:gamma-glutamyltranspeptidase/glutathione hydrolase
MSQAGLPLTSAKAPSTMVVSADQLATQAGIGAMALGGNAVDAAIATNAVMAVVAPHLCGMGGDLLALVHDGTSVHALNASGRAGSGGSSAALRREGLTEIPFRHDPRSITMPGCVDGWAALHERFARLPLATLFAPAIRLADAGFPASPLLVAALDRLDEAGKEQLHELVGQASRPGERVRRPGVAAALDAVATKGRDEFYLGSFGDGLLQVGNGWFERSDLQISSAEWVEPLSAAAFGRILYSIPPNSQGYLLLGSALLADALDLPTDPDDPQWAHLLIEAAKAAGRDRPQVLSDAADGASLLEDISKRGGEIDPRKATPITRRHIDGDTTYMSVVDDKRMAVSLIQSNASNFGSWLVEPNTGINLQNRGTGFSVESGHPAEVLPGRKPPHTLAPALATSEDGSISAVLGTMGGDAQPQILLQLAARLFHHGQSPAEAINAGRWMLNGPVTGFDTWTSAGQPHVLVEGQASQAWPEGLRRRGHEVRSGAAYDSWFGHAHAILVDPATGMLTGACDPRTLVGSVAGT